MVETAAVAEHYESRNLTDRLRAALDDAGLGAARLSARELAPLDQFHSRGLEATVDLASALDLGAETRVLDIGSGLGGPSRYLAETFGCHVTGIDLSPSFVEAASFLAERSGLSERVAYRCADALALPFADASFDLVWTQHVAMNIADRASFYGEAHRVLRPGGRLAIYDVTQGDGRPTHFPLPWAKDQGSSFLLTPDAMRTMLEGLGFRVASWIDRTDAAIAWFAAMQAAQAAASSPPPIGLHLAMGPGFREMTGNLARNLREGRLGLTEAVLERV